MYNGTYLGIKNGLAVYVSDACIAQKGINQVLEDLDMVQRFPVVTSLSGNIVMVQASSQEEAIQKYLEAKK